MNQPVPRRRPSPRLRRAAALLAALLCGAGVADAAIYSCVDANGRRLTSDRPIPDCVAREQRMLNSDGSVRKIVPPTLTADEQAEAEARERRAAAERAAAQDAIRRDRNLLARFPNEAAHQKARDAALSDLANGVKFSENRLAELQRERQPLLTESEFYVRKELPRKLRQQLDANDAATAAQRSLIETQKQELLRIENLYDLELARLRRLWAGAPPGSTQAGPAVQATPPVPPRKGGK